MNLFEYSIWSHASGMLHDYCIEDSIRLKNLSLLILSIFCTILRVAFNWDFWWLGVNFGNVVEPLCRGAYSSMDFQLVYSDLEQISSLWLVVFWASSGLCKLSCDLTLIQTRKASAVKQHEDFISLSYSFLDLLSFACSVSYPVKNGNSFLSKNLNRRLQFNSSSEIWTHPSSFH